MIDPFLRSRINPAQRPRQPVPCRGFQRRLDHWRVTPSMSRKANSYDNALVESVLATLKSECFANSIAAAKLMIFDYIEAFYNTRRRHSALGYRSPAQFEKNWLCSRGELAAAAKAARPASKDRSALAALAVNNSPELFQPPETTRSNLLKTFNSTP